MAITKADFSTDIKEFQFRELFNEMGWNNDRAKQPVIIDKDQFNLTGIAEKSGFRIFICEPAIGNKLPDAAIRKKIEGKVTKLFQEHLIIFIDEHRREQVWQLAVRKAGSPAKISEIRYNISRDPELLYQRASGLFFTLDEEEKVTIIDVTKRVAENFQQNNERVTKKFYESFKKEHTTFLKFIEGIDDKVSMDWYASLMMNRLMFCYFIQKKGFLDNNKNYLQDKLKACKEKKGKNNFYSFYRDFLLALFHEGLGAPEQSCRGDTSIALKIGKIPYLNGGLFDEHEIEKTYKKIAIEDKAFEKLFDFFDQYEWHLDTRESASGKDINPDVIGYIFEKYINDRAQMGAYYTKEDITDYIAKNCIIPWLFDEVKRNYPKAFADDSWLWQMVKTSGDEYIYNAVKYSVPESGGLFDDLPLEIQKGFTPELEKKIVDGNWPWLWELRKEWNKPAPSNIALPTEIYREVIERRKRYADIKSKIKNGEIKEINDFITYNLNIRQFAQDALETTGDAEFIRHFYKALTSVTILDPTCGSGAFLFAAMNILEPLYEACIQRMKNFIDESGKGKYKYFEEALTQVNAPEHPNLQYFIYKSIILNNLYGVDIMNEAVEIAKLRLFLKLVATVDADYRKPNLGLEPLPDVDFNIRAGNTLVGYATEAQLQISIKVDEEGYYRPNFEKELNAFKEKCDIVGRAFARYKEIQLQGNADFEDFKKAKDDLNARLDKLREELDRLLHKQHYSNIKYDKWFATHQPFHWFAEFYEIVQGKGGFDVVIGNPPYVEYSAVRSIYVLNGYSTIQSGNLYVYVIERSIQIQNHDSYNGMIIPLSAYCTDRMEDFQKLEYSNCKTIYLSNYAERPSKLFEGAERNLTIALFRKDNEVTNKTKVYTTYYYKWNAYYRNLLFDNISYSLANGTNTKSIIPKISCNIEASLMKLLRNVKKTISYYTVRNSKCILFYRNSGGRYWKIITNFQPQFYLNSKKGTSSRESYLYFSDNNSLRNIVAILNSSLYYWFYIMNSDARTNNPSDLKDFPIILEDISSLIRNEISSLCEKLMSDFDKNSLMQPAKYRTGNVEFQQFLPQKSKPIIDQIDCLLAQHYGFTQEELDFIINYDIKYRMGKEMDNEEDGE